MIITIPGKPIPQGRVRMGRHGVVYDPQAKDKKTVREVMQYLRPRELFKNPKISFFFYMPVPKSASKRTRFDLINLVVRHIKKPDIDNLIKFYLDCMDGIFFDGDQTVSLGHCAKTYSETPHSLIEIEEGGISIPASERRSQEVK